jgi:hypothetical protein
MKTARKRDKREDHLANRSLKRSCPQCAPSIEHDLGKTYRLDGGGDITEATLLQFIDLLRSQYSSATTITWPQASVLLAKKTKTPVWCNNCIKRLASNCNTKGHSGILTTCVTDKERGPDSFFFKEAVRLKLLPPNATREATTDLWVEQYNDQVVGVSWEISNGKS